MKANGIMELKYNIMVITLHGIWDQSCTIKKQRNLSQSMKYYKKISKINYLSVVDSLHIIIMLLFCIRLFL